MAIEVPQVQRIDRADESAIIRAIIRDRCCIIKNFTDVDTVKKANEETRPYLEADKPWKGDLFPPETRRCTNLVGRSKTVREKWIVDPLIRKITRTFIDKTTSNYYGETKHTYTSEADFHVDHEDQTKTGYRAGSDVMMNFMVPGVKTTFDNGATLAIPGSHLWGSDRVPKANETIYAEMDDEHRILNGFFFCRGFYRQEENPYLCNSTMNVLSWSPEVQRIMGYELSSPNIGFVHFKTPLQHLRGDRIEEFGDFDASQEAM
ncbi:hypothetical protein BDV10DRAFT_190631 [Aspergillus recurvatus]